MAKRRTQEISYNVEDAIEDVRSRLEDLGSEMRNWFDNMPESFQNADKGQRVDECATALEDASASIEDAPASCSLLPSFIVLQGTKRRQSRAERRDEAMDILRATVEHIQQYTEGPTKLDAMTDEIKDEWEEFASSIESVIDLAEQAEFPGMYG